MDISGIREVPEAFYGMQGRKAAGTAGGKGISFKGCMEGAIKDAGKKEGPVFPEGEDVVMSHPPLYTTQFSVDMEKPKEEMTLDEYKQYICNAVSALPVSTSRKLNSSGMLIFKEEAFREMKENPEYEKAVVDMLREKYAFGVSVYTPDVSYQVIGASEEECYGSAIPVKNYGQMMAGLQASGLGLAGLGSLGGALLGTALSGLGLTGSNAYAGWAGAGLGLAGGNAYGGLAGTGVSASGLGLPGGNAYAALAGTGLSGLGMAGLGSSTAGLPGTGNTDFPLAGGTGTLASASGRGRGGYADMVKAYKRTAENRGAGTGLREYKISKSSRREKE